MKRNNEIEIQLPFFGFYESPWIEALDYEISQYAEYRAEDEDELLDEEDFHDILFRAMKYHDAEIAICKCIVDAIMIKFDEEFDLNLSLKFKAMESPRFYNFGTDRLFATIDRAGLAKLVRVVRKDRYAALAEVIRERHTSRSGFHSFYDNTLETWLAKPVSTWDHNELETLITAAVRVLRNSKDDNAFWTWDILSAVAEDGGFYQEFEKAVDWNQFEKECIQRRTERYEGLADEDKARYNRDTQTADLFA